MPTGNFLPDPGKNTRFTRKLSEQKINFLNPMPIKDVVEVPGGYYLYCKKEL